MSRAFFTPLTPSSSTRLRGSTLLVPAVSIGSVPQLAVDLLLHSAALELTKIGRIDPSFCFPFAGPSDSRDESQDITTALEVYANESGLVVIQQRSPVYRARAAEYIAALTAWIRESAVIETLWISSIDAAARTDAEFNTPILVLPPQNPVTPLLKTLVNFPVFQPPPSTNGNNEVPVIPGSLLTRKLLQHTAGTLELGALLYFAAEGDTRADAHTLALTLLSLLPSSPSPTPSSLSEPRSWSSLFGAPADTSLYT